MIRVKNPAAYVKRHTGILLRKTAELNCRMYGTPVCINTGSLQYSFEELKFLMLQKIDNHNLLNSDPNPHFDLVAL
jgi:ribosome biogenesis protein Nip4